MKRSGWIGFGLALVMGCGSTGSSTERAVAGGFCPDGVQIMIRGTDAGAFEHFFVTAPGLEVSAGAGAAIPVALDAGGPLDLTTSDHAFAVGTAAIPAGTSRIVATLPFATVQANLASGSALLDLCTAPLRIVFSADQVDPTRCHVVVHLDLARSVGTQGSGGAFLPNFTVQF
jgi:hypothetical protein